MARPDRVAGRLAAAALGALLTLCGPAGAQIENPRQLEREMTAIRGELVRIAAAVQAREAEIAAATAEMTSLEERVRDREAAYEASRGRLERMLAALALLARSPPNALVGPPAQWADTVRGAVLAGQAAPLLARRAAAAAAHAAELERLGAERARRRDAMRAAQRVLAGEQTRLRQALERKAGLYAATPAKAAPVAGTAADLTSLIDRIEEAGVGEAARGAEAAGFADDPLAGSSLPWPAHGKVVAAFAAAGEDRRPGISIATAPGAQVVAPDGGAIVFAGPFRRYGELLIIEHGGGYHSVMAGLARIDGEVGQRVAAGEPVGAMAGDGEGRVLRVEVRHRGEPVDPVAWLTSDDRKVSG